MNLPDNLKKEMLGKGKGLAYYFFIHRYIV